jgi:SAM-dependent methyltransferase
LARAASAPSVGGVNPNHDELCGSPEWAAYIQDEVLPAVTARVDLGREMLEIGPGPGAATGWLRQRVARLAALERGEAAAAALAAKFPGVEVTAGDATAMSYPDGSFDSVGLFTMLHHVPTTALQNRILAEALRVLRPGGVLVGADSLPSEGCTRSTRATPATRWSRPGCWSGCRRWASARSWSPWTTC